jgi:hypothetical protein
MRGNITREQYAKLAAKASCDIRTVITYCAGLAIRPLVRTRIEKAMRDLDLDHLVKKAAV